MSILDRLVAPLVAPLMFFGMMLPAGQSPVYATETHDINPVVQVKPKIKTQAELRKERRNAIVSRSRTLASKTGTAKANKNFAEFYIKHKYGWGKSQFKCLDKIWTQESHWNHKADNPNSSAYGIPQALPGKKMSVSGKDWRTNPATQIKWGAKYVKVRYGTPCEAWDFKQRRGWY